MISHALFIIQRELADHLDSNYPGQHKVILGNLSEGFGQSAGNVARDSTVLSVINIKEEKALKNIPNYVRDDIKLTAKYQNPPVFINMLVLMTATHSNYTIALSTLSRAIRFFQHKNVFTHDNVIPAALTDPTIHELDRFETFKLIFDLYSPSLEESNHMWGTLGGKQYPSVVYMVRMLDLKFNAVESERGLISEVRNEFFHLHLP